MEQFAIGFGRELFGFTKGETRYSFNILPLGGFVKMLGQEDFDDKSNELKFNDDPRSFANKPVWRRMAIVSAGVVMNIIAACVFFMIVFMIGMEVMGPRVSYVEADSPADRAGMLPGDEIKEINGSRIREFNEVTMAIMLADPHEPIEFIVQRDGGKEASLEVIPETNIDKKRLMIGIAPGLTREIQFVGPEVNTRKSHHPRVGDKLVEIEGQAVTDENINLMRQRLAYASGGVFVERSDPSNPKAPPKRVEVEIPPIIQLYPSDQHDPNSVNLLGLTPLVRVSDLDPKGRAALAGLKIGDTILSWDGVDFPTRGQIVRAIYDNGDRDVPFTVRRADGEKLSGYIRPKAQSKRGGTAGLLCEAIEGVTKEDAEPRARVAEVDPGGAADEAGIEVGDVVVKCGGEENPSRSKVGTLISREVGRQVPITLRKPDGRLVPTYVVPEPVGDVQASFRLIAQDVLRVGKVVETIDGRISPAAEAEIPTGARIVSVNGEALSRWRELIDAFRDNAGSTVTMAYLDNDSEVHEVPFRIPHSLRTKLGLGPEARILSIGGKDRVLIKLSSGEEPVSAGYHEGTKALLQQFVGQERVPVVYRENLLGEAKTGYVDVTEDMIDPWISRVKLAANVEVGVESIILKGENALDAVSIGIHKTYYFVLQVYETINRMLFSRSVGVENLSGPLGIVALGGRVAEAGLVDFLFFLGILSANLAVLNFLPLPIVDGGLMVFLIIEKIKGSPVSLRVQVATQMLGLFLLIGTFIYVTINDALKLFG